MRKAELLAQRTHLGWILSGRARGKISNETLSFVCVENNLGLEKQLRRFWEAEEKVVETLAWTKEQKAAENFL